MNKVLYKRCFVYISTSSCNYDFMVVDGKDQIKLNNAIALSLVTGIYDVELEEITTESITLSPNDKFKLRGSIAKKNAFKFNDFAEGLHLERKSKIYKDQDNMFDLCGMLLEKNRTWIGSKNKKIYKMMTFARVIVNVEVWYNSLTDKTPNIGESIIITNCFIDFKSDTTVIKVKPTLGLQWTYFAYDYLISKIFKMLLWKGIYMEIQSNNVYHYDYYKNYSWEIKQGDIFGWDEWLLKNAYKTLPRSQDDKLLIINATPEFCYYDYNIFDYSCSFCKKYYSDKSLKDHETTCEMQTSQSTDVQVVTDSQGIQRHVITPDRIQLKRAVLRFIDVDTEDPYDIYVQDPQLLGLSAVESPEAMNNQLKVVAKQFFPREIVCREVDEKFVLLSIGN